MAKARRPLPVKEQAIQVCGLIPQNWVTNPEPRGNTAALVYELLVWQTLCKETTDRLKKAWEALQEEFFVVEKDDDMRARGLGEHIVFETKCFSIVATVTKGRKSFELEEFVLAAAEKWKVKPADIMTLIKEHSPEGKFTLSKRVLEAS